MLKLCVDVNKGIEINVNGDITDICTDLTYGIRKLYERIKETNPKDADFFAKQLKDAIPGLVLCENPVLEVLGLVSKELKNRMQAKDGDKSKEKAEDSKEEDEKDLADFMSNFESLIGIICGKISDNEDND